MRDEYGQIEYVVTNFLLQIIPTMKTAALYSLVIVHTLYDDFQRSDRLRFNNGLSCVATTAKYGMQGVGAKNVSAFHTL